MIEIRNITKTFKTDSGTVTALDDVSLTIADGEIFGVIGLSGAGKSTLVRCINLLETPDSGSVLIDGKDMTQLSRRELLETRRNIGMIFQSYNLLEQRTLLKNVCFPLEIAGWKRQDAQERALELLGIVGLADRADAYPSELSGGQKQRVAIARALATDPQYLLCDEATSALDPNTTESILELLKQINRDLGVTLVVITHQMEVIQKICDRVAVIDKSKIAESGTVSDVFSDPQSEIAKDLILPKVASHEKTIDGVHLRLIFDGNSAYEPLISDMILDCRVPVNILFADIQNIEGKSYGQMLIGLPDDEVQKRRVTSWLTAHGIEFGKEENRV